MQRDILRLGLILLLAALLLLLQYDLWVAGNGLRQTQQLRHEIAAQRRTDRKMQKRNDALQAEVKDLKTGLGAVEALARRELGMIGNGETFYQVVRPPRRAADTTNGQETPAPSGPPNAPPSDAGH
ncbi:MAG TPA: cell division protein FtsB [Gammaproteobacteria bacterium]|nr:cell division protein FtsB [Gammaproteobacteria bacterium]